MNHKILCIATLYLLVAIKFNPTAAVNCFECDSKTDTNCISLSLEPNTCPLADGGHCFTSVDNEGIISRGCQTKDDKCDGTCQQCTTDKCNNNLICKSCDSSKDPKCATSQKDALPDTFNSICKDTISRCVTELKTDKILLRRCANDQNDCSANTKDCVSCTNGNCNQDIFPPNRRRCHQCAESEECKVPKQTDSWCLVPDDKCYTVGTEEAKMTRGCLSDTDAVAKKCAGENSDQTCVNCNGDFCNNRTYKRNQNLKCYTCTSQKDGTDCRLSVEESNLQSCKAQLTYTQEEQCYSQVKDGITHRGCVVDREASLGECTDKTECKICNSEQCNRAENENLKCIRCRSDLDALCRTDPGKVADSDCRNTMQFGSTPYGCFRYITVENVIIRGCLSDTDPQMLATCNQNDGTICKICDQPKCNNWKNGAVTNTISISLLGLAFLLIFRLY